MTQKEKAERYDEAIETARKINSGEGIAAPHDFTICEVIFPELKELEDERIRKELIFFLGDMPEDTELRNGVTNRDVLTWLEKQCEQKPVTWSEEDDEMLDSIIEEVSYIGEFPDYPTKEESELYDECLAKVEWLKSLKERYTWKPSVEQIRAFEHFIKSIGESGFASPYENDTNLIYSLLSDLKNLKG